MADQRGGWKAADTALWREHLHAATMVGRVAAARVAVELGYGIEADPGPSGKLGHWRIAGVPGEVMRGALQAGGGDRRRVRPPGRVLLPGPGGGGPQHPPGQATKASRLTWSPGGRASWPTSAGSRASGRVGGRRRAAEQAGHARPDHISSDARPDSHYNSRHPVARNRRQPGKHRDMRSAAPVGARVSTKVTLENETWISTWPGPHAGSATLPQNQHLRRPELLHHDRLHVQRSDPNMRAIVLARQARAQSAISPKPPQFARAVVDPARHSFAASRPGSTDADARWARHPARGMQRRRRTGVWAILAVALVLRLLAVGLTYHEPITHDPADSQPRRRIDRQRPRLPPHQPCSRWRAAARFSGLRPTRCYSPPCTRSWADEAPSIGRLAGAFLGTLAVALIGMIALRLWGRRVGMLALGIAAVAPPVAMSCTVPERRHRR